MQLSSNVPHIVVESLILKSVVKISEPTPTMLYSSDVNTVAIKVISEMNENHHDTCMTILQTFGHSITELILIYTTNVSRCSSSDHFQSEGVAFLA